MFTLTPQLLAMVLELPVDNINIHEINIHVRKSITLATLIEVVTVEHESGLIRMNVRLK